jgi:hypothetical protein
VRPADRVRETLVAAVLALMLTAGAGSAAVAAAKAPKCFGAAARDPRHPCFNPARTFMPAAKDVDVVPSSPCALTKEQPEPVCTFGVAAAKARGQVALVGDSHALHWRGALDVVAKANRWQAWSITASGCFFSDAAKFMAEGARELCVPWYEAAQRWFLRHPQVTTVFVSQNATTPVVVQPTETYLGVKAAGFRRAWARLPRTVRHVIVIRDTPDPRDDLFDCLKNALATPSLRPGIACSTPRTEAMHLDTAVATVRQLHLARYRSVDLTSFFCSPGRCFPVVGGGLVYRDVFGHLTVAYSTSLGRYLGRKVRAIVPATG